MQPPARIPSGRMHPFIPPSSALALCQGHQLTTIPFGVKMSLLGSLGCSLVYLTNKSGRPHVRWPPYSTCLWRAANMRIVYWTFASPTSVETVYVRWRSACAFHTQYCPRASPIMLIKHYRATIQHSRCHYIAYRLTPSPSHNITVLHAVSRSHLTVWTVVFPRLPCHCWPYTHLCRPSTLCIAYTVSVSVELSTRDWRKVGLK